jgi:CsoR family transcriptional regulator, copper-sensing transcriptional repressor
MNNKQKVLHRLQIIEGQIKGLQEMVNKGIYCIDIITQTSAVKQALSGVEDVLMENHLKTCAMSQIKKGRGEKAQAEILKVYKLKRK